jgi:hypothetical protein
MLSAQDPSRVNAMSHQELYLSIENYLATALEVLSSWGEWLSEHERLVLAADITALEQHTVGAERLHADLRRLSQTRGQVLSDAQTAGFACATLKQLAQALPQWNSNADFRQRLKNVERCMARLRRLNMAAWFLVNQCSRVVDQTLLLMTSGTTLQSAYIAVPHADTCGGQLFDSQA